MAYILGYAKNCADLFLQNKKARVHSVYQKIINIQIGNQLVSLQGEDIAKSPMTISIPKEVFQSITTSVGEEVEFGTEGMWGFGRFFSLTNAVSWNMQATFSLENQIPSQKALMVPLAETIEKYRNNGGFGDLVLQVYAQKDGDLDMIQAYAKDILCNMKGYAKAENWANFAKEGAKLIGFGVGLTPSGDDFLMGVLASQYINSKKEMRELILKELTKVIADTVEETTDISREFLCLAQEGMFSEFVLESIRKIQKQEDVKESIEKIAKMGHSSGVDFLNGFFMGCAL